MAQRDDDIQAPGKAVSQGQSQAAALPADDRLYEIRVKGQLDQKWVSWLEGLEVQHLDGGEMLLCGRLVDQAALLGVLNKLSFLNLALISVNRKGKGR